MTGNEEAEASHSALIGESTRLRAAIAETLARIEEIRQQEIPQIKADYATKIGVWNMRLITAQLAARRAKRRCALTRISSNQGRKADADAITRQLDEEFADWKQRVAQETMRLHHLLKWRGGVRPMSPAKAKELNTLFRRLARRFHPDLYPGDEERADCDATAQNALACGDVELLRALDAEILYRHAAGRGHPIGWLCLGYVYAYDRCEGWCYRSYFDTVGEVPAKPDADVLAYECFRHAAEAGIAEGCYKLGDMLTEGTGCTPDYAKALDMFLKAYRYGRDGSPRIWGSVALRLARAYANARGCALDYERAPLVYDRAHRTGTRDA